MVQGVGFRPFVFRLARAKTLAGWVSNGEEGVEIFLEGADQNIEAFVRELTAAPPPAAQITEIDVQAINPVVSTISEFTKVAFGIVPCAHLSGPAGLRRLSQGAL